MEGAASIGHVWTLAAAGVVALAGVLGWTYQALKGKASEKNVTRLWEKRDQDDDRFQRFQIEAAKSFVTQEALTNVETRIMRHMDNGFGGIKEDLKFMRADIRRDRQSDDKRD